MPLIDRDIEHLGPALKHLRERAGFTQRLVARRLGVNASTYCKWESRHNAPPVKRLILLLSTLGADFADLQQAIDHLRRAGVAGNLQKRIIGLERRVALLEEAVPTAPGGRLDQSD